MTTNDQPQTIPADKVRAARDLHRDAAKMVTITDAEREIHQHVADAMEALLPTPPRPTLAEMTDTERAACQWMQADLLEGGRVIILRVDDDGDPDDHRILVLGTSGDVIRPVASAVTPRPDLPPLELPDTYQEATAQVGDVIESADDPRLDALPVGTILLDRDRETVTNEWGDWTGEGYTPIPSQGDEFGPWTVRSIPKEADQ